jgi:hypothetical protein
MGLCGGVSVDDHTLSDFHTQHVDFLDNLLTHGVTAPLAVGLVEFHRVAQAGHAGASCRRQQFLSVAADFAAPSGNSESSTKTPPAVHDSRRRLSIMRSTANINRAA